jgi:hypothetical protein
METKIAHLARELQVLLTSKADEWGRASGFIKRQKKFSGSSFAQTLVFGWMAKAQLTMEELSQSAANVGLAVSRQGIDQRFNAQAAHFMEGLLKEGLAYVVHGKRVATPILWRFSKVYLVDATIIKLPPELAGVWRAGQGAGLKISLCWDLLYGGWAGVHLHAAREHDQQAPFAWDKLEKAALLVRDLGYFKLKVFQSLSAQGVYWLSRYKVGTGMYIGGKPVDLLDWLQHHAHATVDVEVELGLTQRVQCRLIAKPVPTAILQQRQEQLREWERKKQRTASRQRWHLLAWTLYLTNAPDHLLTTAEVETMMRSRWQIEKVFYWWKAEGEIDEWRTHNPWRVLCELYAKLLALLIQHWLLISAEVHDVRRSTIQASRTIRKHAWHLAFVLSDFQRLEQLLEHLVRCLQTGCRISSSSTSPPTFQLFYS